MTLCRIPLFKFRSPSETGVSVTNCYGRTEKQLKSSLKKPAKTSERGWHLHWIVKEELEFSRPRRVERSAKEMQLDTYDLNRGSTSGRMERLLHTMGVGRSHEFQPQGDLDTSLSHRDLNHLTVQEC